MADIGGFFYVSCVAHLTVRFDETLEILEGGKKSPTRAEVQQQLVENTRSRGITGPGASRVPDPSGISSTSVPGKRSPPQDLRPLVFPSDDPYTQIMNRIPIQGNFDLTGTRQAWAWDMQFDFRDLPIDPRVVRAVAVEIHLGTVDPELFSAGMEGSVGSFGQLQSVLRTQAEFTDSQGRTQNVTTLLNHLMTGTVDSWRVVHGEKGSRAFLRGRDLRGILLDTKVPVKAAAELDLEVPINQLIAEIIRTLPIDDDLFLTVKADPSEWDQGKIPSAVVADGLTRVRRGAAGGKGKSTPATADRTTYWDLITQYCNLVGAIPHLIGRKLLIRPAHAIHERILGRTAQGTDIETPFGTGGPRIVDGREIRVRQLAYGRDVKDIEFERKYAGVNVPLVETVSIDDTKRGAEKLLIAQWPPKDSRAAKLKAETDILRIPVPGVKDLERLTMVAKDIYEEVGRGETGGKATTMNASSFGGDNADPDMLRLRPTDAVEFFVDVRALSSRSPLISDLTNHERRSFEEEVKEITERIGDPVLARVLVAVSRGAVSGQLNAFEVNNVRFQWDISRGVTINFDFQNYIVSRHTESVVAEPSEPKPEEHRVVKKGKRKKVPDQQDERPKRENPAATGGRAGTTDTQSFSSRPRKDRVELYQEELRRSGLSQADIDTLTRQQFG